MEVLGIVPGTLHSSHMCSITEFQPFPESVCLAEPEFRIYWFMIMLTALMGRVTAIFITVSVFLIVNK